MLPERRLLSSIVVLAAMLPPLSAQTTFRTVVYRGDQAPGIGPGATVAFVTSPQINTSGQMALWIGLSGDSAANGRDRAVIVETVPGSFAEVLRSGIPLPQAGTGHTVAGFTTLDTYIRMSVSGDVAVTGLTGDNISEVGSFLVVRGPSGSELRAWSGMPVPEMPTVTPGAGVWNSPGDVLALLPGGTAVMKNAQDGVEPIFISHPGTGYTLTGPGVVPMTGSGSSGGAGSTAIGQFLVSPTGRVLFVGWAGSPFAGSASYIAELFPGSTHMRFSHYDPPSYLPPYYRMTFESAVMNGTGRLAFVHGIQDAGSYDQGDVVVVEGPSGLTLVAREGDLAPAGSDTTDLYAEFGTYVPGIVRMTPFLADDGTVIFGARLSGPSVTTANDVAVFASRGGTTRTILREGMPAPFDISLTVSSITDYAANAFGDAVLSVTLTGPGVTSSTNTALLLAVRTGETHLLFREGQALNLRPGLTRTVVAWDFAPASRISTGKDGLPSVFSPNGLLALALQFSDATDAAVTMDVSQLLPERVPVKVMVPDSTGAPRPLANAVVQVSRLNPLFLSGPLQLIHEGMTDVEGIVDVDVTMFQPGDPFVISTIVRQRPAVKPRDPSFSEWLYETTLDNLDVLGSGLFADESLEALSGALTTTILDRPSMAFDLTMSIEWKARTDYVESLRRGLRDASNYLYDVTNGQAWIRRVHMIDDKRRWNESDIRILADNRQWPMATLDGGEQNEGYVWMPPRWFGDKKATRVGVYHEQPLDPSRPDQYRTIVHELGHYLFGIDDEYRTSSGQNLTFDINYGFMDSHYAVANDPWPSEMSDAQRTNYQQTAQFARDSLTSWKHFVKKFSGIFENVRVQFVAPSQLPYFSPMSPWLTGPNDNLNSPEYAVADEMEFTVDTAPSELPNAEVLLGTTGDDEAMRGTLARSDGRMIVHGGSDTTRHLRLLGASPGDSVLFESDEGFGFQTIVVSPVPERTLSSSTPHKQQTASVQSLFARLDLTETSVEYVVQPEPLPEAAPSVRLSDDVLFALGPMTADGSVFRTWIPLDTVREGHALLTFEEGGFALHRWKVAEIDSAVSRPMLVPGGRLELDTTYRSIDRVGMVASKSPTRRDGLPTGLRRISEVYSITVSPAGSPVRGQLTIDFSIDGTSDTPTMYGWTGSQWQALETKSDGDRAMATAVVTGPGSYAVFADSGSLRPTTHADGSQELPRDHSLGQNYPNPFNPETTIPFSLSKRSSVQMEIFDVLGRRVAEMVEHDVAPGEHVARWTARTASGIYFYRLIVNDGTGPRIVGTRRMVVVR